MAGSDECQCCGNTASFRRPIARGSDISQCVSACDAANCGGHGACLPSSGRCVCEDGFRSDPSDAAGCGDGDLVALLAFKNSGDPRHVLSSWSSCSLSPLASDPNVTAAGYTFSTQHSYPHLPLFPLTVCFAGVLP